MTRPKTRTLLAYGLSMSALISGVSYAETGDRGAGPLDHYVLYGINSSTNQLVTYQFGKSRFEPIDTIRDAAGNTLTGIEAAAHVPGNLNLFAFWTDPGDNETKLLYIDSETAEAELVGQSLGAGQITGATISWKDGDQELDDGGDTISGLIQINPNDAGTFEFKLIKPDGAPGPEMITRDDLHRDSQLNYVGPASMVRVKPAGRGSQTGLSVEGASYDMLNNNTYVISGGEMQVEVFNDHVVGGKAMGHWWLKIANGGSAVIHEAGQTYGYTGLFAVQKIEADEESTVAFDIVNGEVVPLEDFAAKVTVLGAQITNGNYDVPVTMRGRIDTTWFSPFDDYSLAVDANVNDDKNPRKHILPSIYPAGTPLMIGARSYVKTSGNGKKNSHWSTYRSVSAGQNPANMLVLKHGDPVPNHPAFTDPNETLDFVIDYVDHTSQTIVLDENQVIVLFELGTTDLTSPTADFQDLVVLVTLAKDPVDLQLEDDDDDAAAGPASRLVKVHSSTGGFEQIMTLDRVYDSLAASHNGMFYAAHDGQLYELNPYDQVETAVGPMPNTQMLGMEFAGPDLCGFTVVADRLVPIDVATGQAMGPDMDISTTDLHTIIFMEDDKIPASLAAFD